MPKNIDSKPKKNNIDHLIPFDKKIPVKPGFSYSVLYNFVSL